MKLPLRLVAMSAVFAVWTGLPALAAEEEGSASQGDEGAQILHDLSTLGNSLVHELFNRGREIIDAILTWMARGMMLTSRKSKMEIPVSSCLTYIASRSDLLLSQDVGN